MLLGVQTSFSSVLHPRPRTFCGDLHTLYLLCSGGCSDVSPASLAESLLGWIIYLFLFSNRGLTFLAFHNVGCIRSESCCSLGVH